MKTARNLLLSTLALAACTSTPGTTGSQRYSGQAWADNWFSMSIGDQLIIEDSVSITTERSFNAETFSFDATPPFVMSFVLEDFREDDSGLEYIGKPNQQMGDGGFIAQIKGADASEPVAVSDSSWRCLVIHRAPLNKDCEASATPLLDCEFTALDEPAGWKDADFDDSGWSLATVHTSADVGPKDGYDEIEWHPSARLVWGPDLESDNTILCRAWVQ